jgi:hypothetical protein
MRKGQADLSHAAPAEELAQSRRLLWMNRHHPLPCVVGDSFWKIKKNMVKKITFYAHFKFLLIKWKWKN